MPYTAPAALAHPAPRRPLQPRLVLGGCPSPPPHPTPQTPLLLATCRNHTSAMSVLLDAGAVVDERMQVPGCMRAWRLGGAEARGPAEAHAQPCPPPPTAQDGTTPLFAAAACNAPAAARLLLERGADAAARSRYGSAPIHDAAAAGNAQLVGLLLAHGADARQGPARCPPLAPLLLGPLPQPPVSRRR